ncbi:helix-turn-helix transcriptional regulator [Chryseobacterium limigenitum]|uniref:AraC-type DNA-binding protein n=1 Tax=Chryseobacterium limigenitum TaxID=1612149 RepID=A0A1K2IWA7_9FLAO|nr:AraC family transcriptional regulator [Chryseobacterium limigenitum]SFZ96554.1 AraC-type DNA-binding protein [Chryseobacterium limigenitum]
MELILPYLEADGFKQGLVQDYRFGEKNFLNSTILEMPLDLGSGKLVLFNNKNFHFFRGKWNFHEETIFHSPHKVGDNGMMDFRINREGKVSSNFIYDEKEFEHNTTDIDGVRIFVPKSIFPKDNGLLKEKLENAHRNYLSQEKLKTIFDTPFDDASCSVILESRILEFLSYWIHYLLSEEKAFENKNAFVDKIKLAKDFVDTNALQNLAIKEISRYCGLNSCDLKKGFKDYTQLPIHQYIIKARMEMARSMLLETGKSVGEISDFIGYNNRGHFSQLYLRYFGKLPSEERL